MTTPVMDRAGWQERRTDDGYTEKTRSAAAQTRRLGSMKRMGIDEHQQELHPERDLTF